jgi:hypothetical protein
MRICVHEIRGGARDGYLRFVALGMRKKPGKEEPAGVWVGSREFGELRRQRMAGKVQVREYPRRQRLLNRPELASYFPPQVRKARPERNGAIYRAGAEGR